MSYQKTLEAVRKKVAAIFDELVGERAERLDGAKIAEPAMSRIEAAFSKKYRKRKARDLGFHMADWNSDAAFIVAVHLFPERFTLAEIRAGVAMFLIHAPNHIRAACGITGDYVWVDFPDANDEGARPRS